VSGPELHEIRECVEPTERGVELVSRFTHRAGDTCGALEQIGAPDVADEEEVAGENAER
jgi:hypothetical protein